MTGSMNPLNDFQYGTKDCYISANSSELSLYCTDHGYHVWNVRSCKGRIQVFIDLFVECDDIEDFVDHMDLLWPISKWSVHYGMKG